MCSVGVHTFWLTACPLLSVTGLMWLWLSLQFKTTGVWVLFAGELYDRQEAYIFFLDTKGSFPEGAETSSWYPWVATSQTVRLWRCPVLQRCCGSPANVTLSQKFGLWESCEGHGGKEGFLCPYAVRASLGKRTMELF